LNEYAEYILGTLKANSNPQKASWLENYVKHNIRSLGVGIPRIRDVIRSTEKEYKLLGGAYSSQKEMLDDLMQNEYTESKLAAILYIQLFLKKENPEKLVDLISNWFDKNWIRDWNICDWLCVRLLSPLVDHHSDITLRELELWNQHKNLWKARASLVPFAQCKTINAHWTTIENFSITLIKRDERFCKTAVGWVMRQYSKVDPSQVTEFLNKHEEWTTPEVIKNARKYMK